MFAFFGFFFALGIQPGCLLSCHRGRAVSVRSGYWVGLPGFCCLFLHFLYHLPSPVLPWEQGFRWKENGRKPGRLGKDRKSGMGCYSGFVFVCFSLSVLSGSQHGGGREIGRYGMGGGGLEVVCHFVALYNRASMFIMPPFRRDLFAIPRGHQSQRPTKHSGCVSPHDPQLC